MSNTANNSGNLDGYTWVITTGAGGGGGGNVNYIPVQHNHGGWYTFSIPYGAGIPTVIAPVEKKKDSDGCNCKKCKEFFPYAEPNQDDGTLVCYACRHGY